MVRRNQKNEVDWFIANRIRELRTQKGLSQQDIAIHLNVSTGYIGHVESPRFRAKYKTVQLNELAKFLKCSPKDFWPDAAL